MTVDLSQQICTVFRGKGPYQGERPIVAAAIHDGHAIREELQPLLAISEQDRLREADAFTSYWTNIAPTRIVALRSRFEIDLNRRRHRAVYLKPDDAWGLTVWKQAPAEEVIQHSLALYDAFYERMRLLFESLVEQHGHFFVYDLHSYNHQRGGIDAARDDPQQNPQVNICTGGMDLERCGVVVDTFERSIRAHDFPFGKLDVRRNVRFRATRFSRWVHENFPGKGISLALEISKFYMNEWTGQPDARLLHAMTEALRSTVEPVHKAMSSLHG